MGAIMRFYAQFLNHDANGKLVHAMASDGVFILDGRNNLETMKQDSRDQMHALRNVQPHYLGFAIMQGVRFSDSTEVYREMK